jgi:hypothetical protein
MHACTFFAQIRSVAFCGRKAPGVHHTSVVSGSCDHTVKAWSLVDGAWHCTKTFKVRVQRRAWWCGERMVGKAGMGGGGGSGGMRGLEPAVARMSPRRLPPWIPDRPTPPHPFQGHTDSVLCAAVSEVGDVMASCGLDATARLWDWHTGVCFAVLRGHIDAVQCLDISRCGRCVYLVAGTGPGAGRRGRGGE